MPPHDRDIHSPISRTERPARSRQGAEGSSGTDDGVDVTLIHWMLDLDPAERLAALQGAVRSILKLRDPNHS
jgi:hypothetical protein